MGRNLAEQTHVPGNYLSKILLTLRNAGMVEATRGTGGGYRLGRHPDEILLIDVVELFEGPLKETICLLDSAVDCGEKNSCVAHEEWAEVYSSYLLFLQSTRLSDIASIGGRPFLQIPSKPADLIASQDDESQGQLEREGKPSHEV